MSRADKLKWRSYWGCLLPFAGILIVFFYLAVFSIYRDWRIGSAWRAPTDVDSLFKVLSSHGGNQDLNAVAEINNAISTKNVVAWGYSTGLVAILLLFGIAITGYVIWKAPRDITKVKRWIITVCLMVVAVVLYPLLSNTLFENYTIIARQFWEGISSQLKFQHEFISLFNVETFVVKMGFALPLALAFASAATLWPVREIEKPVSSVDKEQVEKAAHYVSMQMKYLRLVLYIGAILLLVIMFRHKATLNWTLEYLKPLSAPEKGAGVNYAMLMYGHLEALVAHNVTATSIVNTLLLAALYVPASMLLHHRALKLSRRANVFKNHRPLTSIDAVKAKIREQKQETKDRVDEEDAQVTPQQAEWMKSHGLTHPLKEQLPKIAAILSPLLAGPVSEMLNLFR